MAAAPAYCDPVAARDYSAEHACTGSSRRSRRCPDRGPVGVRRGRCRLRGGGAGACGAGGGGGAASGRVAVVTTVSPITSIVSAVAGDDADIVGIVPEG